MAQSACAWKFWSVPFTLFFCFVQQVHDGKNLKGRANDAIASACLYIACRQEGVPRTFKASLLYSSPYELLLTMFIK